MDSVQALGCPAQVTGQGNVWTDQLLALDLDLPTAIVEPVATLVLKDVMVATATSLPGLIVHQDHFSGNRVVQLKPGMGHAINEEVIDEQLPARGYVDGIRLSGPTNRRDRK